MEINYTSLSNIVVNEYCMWVILIITNMKTSKILFTFMLRDTKFLYVKPTSNSYLFLKA